MGPFNPKDDPKKHLFLFCSNSNLNLFEEKSSMEIIKFAIRSDYKTVNGSFENFNKLIRSFPKPIKIEMNELKFDFPKKKERILSFVEESINSKREVKDVFEVFECIIDNYEKDGLENTRTLFSEILNKNNIMEYTLLPQENSEPRTILSYTLEKGEKFIKLFKMLFQEFDSKGYIRHNIANEKSLGHLICKQEEDLSHFLETFYSIEKSYVNHLDHHKVSAFRYSLQSGHLNHVKYFLEKCTVHEQHKVLSPIVDTLNRLINRREEDRNDLFYSFVFHLDPLFYDIMKRFWVSLADKFDYEVPSSFDNDYIRKRIEDSFTVLENYEQYIDLHKSISKNSRTNLKKFFMTIRSYKEYHDSQEQTQDTQNNNAN